MTCPGKKETDAFLLGDPHERVDRVAVVLALSLRRWRRLSSCPCGGGGGGGGDCMSSPRRQRRSTRRRRRRGRRRCRLLCVAAAVAPRDRTCRSLRLQPYLDLASVATSAESPASGGGPECMVSSPGVIARGSEGAERENVYRYRTGVRSTDSRLLRARDTRLSPSRLPRRRRLAREKDDGPARRRGEARRGGAERTGYGSGGKVERGTDRGTRRARGVGIRGDGRRHAESQPGTRRDNGGNAERIFRSRR